MNILTKHTILISLIFAPLVIFQVAFAAESYYKINVIYSGKKPVIQYKYLNVIQSCKHRWCSESYGFGCGNKNSDHTHNNSSDYGYPEISFDDITTAETNRCKKHYHGDYYTDRGYVTGVIVNLCFTKNACVTCGPSSVSIASKNFQYSFSGPTIIVKLNPDGSCTIQNTSITNQSPDSQKTHW